MSTGYWDPSSEKNQRGIDDALLLRLLALAESNAIDDLPKHMSEQDKSQQAIMQASMEQWQAALHDYDEQQLIDLIRFFTVAEPQLPNWVGGATSPVISIHYILKQRGGKLSRDMLLWMREQNSNRFLPNGAIL